jgi:hypothetical protein
MQLDQDEYCRKYQEIQQAHPKAKRIIIDHSFKKSNN